MRTLFITLLALFTPLYAPSSHAGLDEAMAAYKNRDYFVAMDELRPLAEQGNAEAQQLLGYLYANGLGVTTDYLQAATWYRKAAAQGNAAAQNNLGTLYYSGHGVPKDYAEAANWYRKAAEQGNENAQRNLRNLEYQEPSLFGWRHSDDTQIRAQAATSCRNPKTWFDIEECYIDALKRYRGRPESLLEADARDAVAYCEHAGESNDSYFCSDLRRRYRSLFNDEARQLAEASAWDKKKRDAEEARRPRTQSVVAQGVSVVPGAIVCPDYETVNLMFHWYTTHWTETAQDTLTKGQSRLLRGPPVSEPNLAPYGCALIRPGTPMIMETGNVVPVVSAKLPNGKTIRGVTYPSMIKQ